MRIKNPWGDKNEGMEKLFTQNYNYRYFSDITLS